MKINPFVNRQISYEWSNVTEIENKRTSLKA